MIKKQLNCHNLCNAGVYYDGPLIQQQDPLRLDKITFKKNDDSGIRFVEIFSKRAFMKDFGSQYIKKFLREFNFEKKKNKLIKIILSNETKEKFIRFLKRECDDYGNDIFTAAMKEVSLEIKSSIIVAPTPTTNTQTEPNTEPTSFLMNINLWEKPLNAKIIPTSFNLKLALERLYKGDILKTWELTHLKALGLLDYEKNIVKNIIDAPGGMECQEMMNRHKTKFKGTKNHSDVPKCLLCTFLIGNFVKENSPKKLRPEFLNWLLQNGVVGKINAGGAVFQVGSSTGKALGLLDQNNTPTKLYHSYFEL